MKLPFATKTHPFPFLLYLEWLLLFVAAITEFLPAPHKITRFPLLTIPIMVIFGLIGLRLPKGKITNKIIYTGVEIGLILLAASLDKLRLFPFLYLIVVIRSCLIFKLPGQLAISGFAFGLFLITWLNRLYSIKFQMMSEFDQERLKYAMWSSTLLFALVLAFVLMLINALLSERKSRENLTAAHEQLRQYALRIEDQATLQERNRIARDIHDSLGHSLTALNLQLETALKLWTVDHNKAYNFLSEAKRLGSTSLQEVRRSVSALRSDALQGKSLQEAIVSLAEDLHRSTGITPDYNINLPYSIPPDISTAIYRILQESLTNICKYASATEVKIEVLSSATKVILIVQDNGEGFDIDKNTTGFGLLSMRDRATAIGGTFQIKSSPGEGCQIQASFILHHLDV